MNKIQHLMGVIIGLTLVCTFAQAQPSCLDIHNYSIQSTDNSAAFEDYVRRFTARGGHLNKDVKTIPVVVHVLYESIADSLGLDRIEGQIEALTLDFRRQNADADRTRDLFKSVAADLQVEFCLVSKDPQGSATPGITWHYIQNIDQQPIFDIMRQTQWNPKRYLNIWVSPTTEGGHSSFPWEDAAETVDGFIVGTRVFGTFGDIMEGFGEGGVVSHEAGHYLGLYHTFHDGFKYLGECNVPCDTTGDFVCDTPLDWNLAWAIGSCEEGERFCEDGSTFFVQSENFMAYSNDTCWNMFSEGQRIRVRAALDSLRAELVSPENLLATGCELSTGIPNQPLAGKLHVFPQPASRELTVDFGEELPAFNLRIWSTDGKILLQQEGGHARQVQLQLPEAPPGLYILQVTAGRKVWVEKIVRGR